MGKFVHGLRRRADPRPLEYNSWSKMKDRCGNPNSTDWEYYGGRGITICERWQDFTLFLADMGPRPSSDHSIERVDNERGYEPGNCIWATRDVQARNRRQRQPQTKCQRGHPFDEANTYLRPDGRRGCKECRRASLRAYRTSMRETAHV